MHVPPRPREKKVTLSWKAVPRWPTAVSRRPWQRKRRQREGVCQERVDCTTGSVTLPKSFKKSETSQATFTCWFRMAGLLLAPPKQAFHQDCSFWKNNVVTDVREYEAEGVCAPEFANDSVRVCVREREGRLLVNLCTFIYELLHYKYI